MLSYWEACIIIPTYNNAGSIADILGRTRKVTRDIIVVNDGSKDDTRTILNTFSDIVVIHHGKNHGKGKAIKTGFATAINRGYKYAITMDADGQHYPEDIIYMINALYRFQQSIIVGARNMAQSSVPSKSSFGNKFSNFWIWLYTGIDLPDSQSGFRLYPLQKIQAIRLITWKFEFEVEILVRAAWRNIPLQHVPVRVYYPPGDLRVSHFRPIKDFTRITILNTVLGFLAFFYYIPVRMFKKWRDKGFRKSLKEMIHDPETSMENKAASIGFGVFMGVFPVWGYQLIIGLALCQVLRLNKALFVLAAHVSIPPMIPLILFASYLIGGVVMQEGTSMSFNQEDFTLSGMANNLYQYLVGAVLLSIFAGIFTFLVSWLVYKICQPKKPNCQFNANE